MLITYIHNIF